MEQAFSSFIRKLLDLRHGAEEKHAIIENVKDDADFSSARFWTLVCAIVVASVGLNINSIPVVIGAMLISPLMGPIVSMGLALAIFDWELLRRSFRNLATLTTISIGISALYFALTPIDTAQTELLARTQPTLFDVIIAIFGGIAGFIGISRAKHTNVVTGVAIATALIPPLCTVGYGVSTWQFDFIFGAAYLFIINCIFICLASLFVAKYLKLPKREYLEEKDRRHVSYAVSALTLVIVSPAIYFAYAFVAQTNFNENVDRYLRETFIEAGHVIIYEQRFYDPRSPVVELAFLTDQLDEREVDEFKSRLPLYDLEHLTLHIRQDADRLTNQDWKTLLARVENADTALVTLEKKLAEERRAATHPQKVLREIQTIYPAVTDIAVGDLAYSTSAGSSTPVVMVYHDPMLSLTLADAVRIEDWLRARLSTNLSAYFLPPPLDVHNSNETALVPNDE